MTIIDRDGNRKKVPSPTGFSTRATIQPLGLPWESTMHGDLTMSMARLRLPQGTQRLGPASRIEWEEKSWSIVGEPQVFCGSPRTYHVDYVIKRS
jgi:hypothetical protein